MGIKILFKTFENNEMPTCMHRMKVAHSRKAERVAF